MGRVVEGADHTGHVPEAGALEAPFAQRAGRLALEVHNDEAVSRVQHLAQVIVPVVADLDGIDPLPGQLGENAQEVVLRVHDVLGLLAHLAAQPWDAAPKGGDRPAAQIAQGLVHGTLVVPGEGLGPEGRIVRAQGQGQVELPGDASQQMDHLQEVAPDAVVQALGNGVVSHIERGERDLRHRLPRLLGEHGVLEELVQVVLGEGPGVALVGHVLLQHAQDVLPHGGVRIADLARVVRDVGKFRLVREKGGDLGVRIDALLHAAIELEDVAVPVEQGGVALLRTEQPRLHGSLQGAKGLRRLLARNPGEIALVAVDVPALGDQGEKRSPEGGGLQGVVQPTGALAGPDPGQDLGSVLRLRLPGFPVRGVAHGEEIDFRFPLDVADLQLQEMEFLIPGGDGDVLPDEGPADLSGLGAEPPLVLQVSGQDALLQAHLVRPVEDLPPVLAQDHAVRLPDPLPFGLQLGFGMQGEPEVVVGPQGEDIAVVLDFGKAVPAEDLHRDESGVVGQVELRHLREAGEVDHHQDAFPVVFADEGQDLVVVRQEVLDVPPSEGAEAAARGDEAAHPPQQGGGVLGLVLHVEGLEVVFRVHDHREIELLGVGHGESGVAVRAPLHGGAHAVAVAQVVVVPHSDLVPVVDHRRSGQGEEETVHQLHLAPVVVEQGGQPAPDAQVDAGLGIAGVDPVHVVPLLVGDHLQGQLVVIAQEDGPLAVLRDARGLFQNVDEGEAVLHPQGHVQPGHDGEVEGHVAFVPVAEVVHRVLRPLVGLGQEHAAFIVGVHVAAQLLEKVVGLGEVLAVGALPLEEVGHGVQAHSVHAQVHPEIDDLEHAPAHFRVVEVEIRLVRVEAVPEVGPGHGIPGPVGGLEVLEDDPGLLEFLRRVAPDVEVPERGFGVRAAGQLEPAVLVRGVVEHQLGDHPEAAIVGGFHEFPEVLQGPVVGVDVEVVRDVVPVVLLGRGVEGQQPDRGDTQVLEVVQLLEQPLEIADAVSVGVHEGLHVELVDNRVLVPLRIVRELDGARVHRPLLT